jgi:phage baseplate assembly protein W
MPIRKKTIGVGFPFKDSTDGDYLQLNTTVSQEIKSNFIHLLMTTKGERYFLPQFGTNLRQYLFDPQGQELDEEIRKEISDAALMFMPNVKIKNINITHYGDGDIISDMQKYTITISIDYSINSGNFDFTDNATLNF